jgi:hypothetical protein
MPWCCFTASLTEPIQKLQVKVPAPLLVQVPVAVKGPIVMREMPLDAATMKAQVAAVQAEVAAVTAAVEAVEAEIIENEQNQLDLGERETCAADTILYTLALYLMMSSIFIFIQEPRQPNVLSIGYDTVYTVD